MRYTNRPTAWERFAARWGVATAALCGAQLILAVAVAGGDFRLSAATVGIRLALFAEECLALGVLAALPAISERRIVAVPLGIVTVVIFAGGWIALLATDRFAGLDSIHFVMTVPAQALEHLLHFRAALLVVAPAAIALGTMALLWLMARASDSARSVWPKAITCLSGAVIVLAAGWYPVARHRYARSQRELFDPATGVTFPTAVYWHDATFNRAGPASAILSSLRRPEATFVVDPSVPIDETPRPDGTAAVTGTPTHHWNVIVLVIESMRADVLQAGGGTVRAMPTVEAIAAGATRYVDAYTTATQTNLAAPVPLSGQFPLRESEPGAYPVHVLYPKVLIYDVLAPLGWRAAVFSSQNEAWWGMENFLRSPSLDTFFHAENFHGHTSYVRQDIGFARFVTKAKHSGKIDDHDTVEEAIRWLERDRKDPFFLYVNFQTSHVPYTIPADAPHPFGPPLTFPVSFGRFPRDSAAAVHRQYLNAMAYIDTQIDSLHAALVADGRWDSTIVVITGDHGQAFYEHGVAAHGNGLWQEQVRVPLIIRIPGESGATDPRPASHVDVAPTIAALLGLPPQPAWQGISLAGPVPAADRPRFFIVQSPLANEVGVVSGRWKMVRDVTNGSARFTDLANDAGERENDSTADPAVAHRLGTLLDTWRAIQLRYYGTPEESARFYPPRVALPATWDAGTTRGSLALSHAPALKEEGKRDKGERKSE